MAYYHALFLARYGAIVNGLLDCGHVPSEHSSFTTGYGIDADGKKHCYQCCAENDRKTMRDTGKICLYLCPNDSLKSQPQWNGSGSHKVTNWPGSLEFPTHYIKTGRHNIAGVRYDFWFQFEGEQWHGVQYGDNTQIAHCQRTKTA